MLLAARPGVGLEPCFGAGSAAAHAASGAMALPGDWPSLRRDVDTADDLADAVRLGLGPRTGAIVLAGALPLAAGPGPEPRRPGCWSTRARSACWAAEPVQGTVATFDEPTGAGSVVLDDGTTVEFPAAAFAASGLRLLRPGQRVRLDPRSERPGGPRHIDRLIARDGRAPSHG